MFFILQQSHHVIIPHVMDNTNDQTVTATDLKTASNLHNGAGITVVKS